MVCASGTGDHPVRLLSFCNFLSMYGCLFLCGSCLFLSRNSLASMFLCAQVLYAAADAFYGFEIFRALFAHTHSPSASLSVSHSAAHSDSRTRRHAHTDAKAEIDRETETHTDAGHAFTFETLKHWCQGIVDVGAKRCDCAVRFLLSLWCNYCLM